MEWRILLAFVFLAIMLGSVLSIAYSVTPVVRNLPDTTEVNYNMVNVNPVANVDDPYDLNAGWKGFYRDHLHTFDSSGNYI